MTLCFVLLASSKALAHSNPLPQDTAPASYKNRDIGESSRVIAREGRVVRLEAEGKDGGHLTFFALETAEGERVILRGGGVQELSGGEQVLIRGQLGGEKRGGVGSSSDMRLSIDSLRILKKPRIQKPAHGVRGAMIVFPSWAGSGTSGYGTYGDHLAGLTDWSRNVSDGRFQWDPVTRVDMRLTKPLVSCEQAQEWGFTPDFYWHDEVKKKLDEMGYNLDNYRALAIALPRGFAQSCVWTAYAYVDSTCKWGVDYHCNLSVYTYEYSDFPTFAHELGHTLSLPHANAAPCAEDGVKVPLTYSGQCLNLEYGDIYDPMGTSRSAAMYNPILADQMNWIEDTDIRRLQGNPDVTTQDTFILKPYGGLEGDRVALVDLPATPELGGTSSGSLYLEYRARAGLDEILYEPREDFPNVSCLAYTPSSNIFLRYLPSPQAADLLGIAPYQGLWGMVDESYLLDMQPETGTRCDSGLSPGRSWSDPTGELKVSFLGRSSDLSQATLQLTRKPWSAQRDFERPSIVAVKRPRSPRSDYSSEYRVTFTERVRQFTGDDITFLGRRGCITKEAFRVEEIDGGRVYDVYLNGCQRGSVYPAIVMDGVSDMATNTGLGKAPLGKVVFDRWVKRPRLRDHPARLTRERSAHFAWQKNSEGRFYCSLDGEPFRRCALAIRYRNLSPGRHSFRLLVKDRAGNWDFLRHDWRIPR